MRITVFPADVYGCGYFRLIWAAELLKEQGHDIDIIRPGDRRLELTMDGELVRDVVLDTDVAVFQRITHSWVVQAVPILRRKGVAVVVDMDDDLSCIHPSNPAYAGMHPRNEWTRDPGRKEPRRHNWKHLSTACREATLVTVSTPGLMGVYARHGRGRVIYNHLPDAYFGVEHADSDVIGWPAALVSHPDDPSALGGALARLTADGAAFRVVGDPTATGSAFGLLEDPPGLRGVNIHGWPAAVATIGVGIAPLADTRFNTAKSWLKPLEMSALGVPWVGSPRAEYTRLNALGAGVLAGTPRRWYRELDRLRRSAEMRADVAGRGRAVAERFHIRDNAWRWLEAWQHAYDVQKGRQAVKAG
jgi:hypothetical protein